MFSTVSSDSGTYSGFLYMELLLRPLSIFHTFVYSSLADPA
jgi:hypothetical protein